jgi:hypothetical protein
VREKRDFPRLAREEMSVEDCRHRSERRADSTAREWLTPDVEEVAEWPLTGDSMWMIPSAACVCSHMKQDAEATKRPVGVSATS